MYIKSFLLSTVESILIFLLSFIFHKESLCLTLLGGIGASFFLISLVLSGVLGRGDRIRLNYAIEPKEDNQLKKKIQLCTFLISLPNIVTFLIIYFSMH